MPYSKLSEANVKKLDGVALSLAQANKIAKMADAIGGEYAWPTAIKNFKRKEDGSIEVVEPEKLSEKCPECGGDLMHRQGKFGRFISCSNYFFDFTL